MENLRQAQKKTNKRKTLPSCFTFLVIFLNKFACHSTEERGRQKERLRARAAAISSAAEKGVACPAYSHDPPPPLPPSSNSFKH